MSGPGPEESPEAPESSDPPAPSAHASTTRRTRVRSRGQAAPDDPARPRLSAGLRRPGGRQLVVAVLVGLLGFGLVTQLRARSADDPYAGLRTSDLIQVLNGLNAQSRRSGAEITDLERTRSQLLDSTQRRRAAEARAREETTTLGILAGTIAASGPGIRVTVDDPEGRLSLNNLLDAVEELRAAGAEAMEFNDTVRVIASTSFEQTDGSLIVGGQRLTAPYVIDAIGNPDTLLPVLDLTEGFGYDVDQIGGSVTAQKLASVKITSVVALPKDDLAKPQG